MLRNKILTVLMSAVLAFMVASAALGSVPQAASQAGYGGNPGSSGAPSFNVPLSDTPNEIVITACKSASTSAHLFKLYKGLTGAQYQVTTGFHFVAHDIEYFTSGTANADGFQFLTGTAALAQDDDTVAPTGVVWAMGASGKPQFYASQLGWNTIRQPVCFAQSLYAAIQPFNNTGNPNICITVSGREYTGASCQ